MAILNRVRVVWTGVAGSPAYTNLYSLSGAVTPGAAVTYTDNLMNVLKGWVNTSVTITTEGDVAQVDSATDQIVGVSTVSPMTRTGSGTGSAFPPANQILVRWLTGSFAGGRQIRGRMYIPYLTTGAATGSGVNPAAITSINGGVSSYLTAMGPAAVVYSRKNHSSPAISSFSVWNQFGVMRSRRD